MSAPLGIQGVINSVLALLTHIKHLHLEALIFLEPQYIMCWKGIRGKQSHLENIDYMCIACMERLI